MSREVLITFLTRLVVIVCGIGTSILSARLLGPAGRGDFFLALTLGAAITQFGNLGIHSSNTYDVARDPKLLSGLLANSLWIAFVFGGSISLATAVILHLHPSWLNTPSALICAGAAIAPGTLMFNLCGSLLLGAGKVATFNLLQALQALLLPPALAFAFLAVGTTLSLLAASFLATLLAAAIAYLTVARLTRVSFHFRWDLVRTGIHFAGRAYVVCVLGFVMIRVNAFVLRQVCTGEELGYYSIAAQVADYLSILPASIALVLFPRLVRSQESSWAMTRRSLAWVAGVMLCGCIVCGLLITPFVRIAYGEAFLPCVSMTWCILPGVFFYGLISVLSQYLASRGIPNAVLAIWLGAVALLAVLSVPFSRALGGVGAAVAFSISSTVTFLLLLGLAMLRARSSLASTALAGPKLRQAA